MLGNPAAGAGFFNRVAHGRFRLLVSTREAYANRFVGLWPNACARQRRSHCAYFRSTMLSRWIIYL